MMMQSDDLHMTTVKTEPSASTALSVIGCSSFYNRAYIPPKALRVQRFASVASRGTPGTSILLNMHDELKRACTHEGIKYDAHSSFDGMYFPVHLGNYYIHTFSSRSVSR